MSDSIKAARTGVELSTIAQSIALGPDFELRMSGEVGRGYFETMGAINTYF